MRLLRPLSSETIVFLCPRRYLLQNMDWLEEEVGEYEDDYLIIDCPGMSDVRRSHVCPPFFFWPIVAASHAVARLDPRQC